MEPTAIIEGQGGGYVALHPAMTRGTPAPGPPTRHHRALSR